MQTLSVERQIKLKGDRNEEIDKNGGRKRLKWKENKDMNMRAREEDKETHRRNRI